MSVNLPVIWCVLQAKMESGDPELMTEGCHGLWELSINRSNHVDIKVDRMAVLLQMIDSNNITVEGRGMREGEGGEIKDGEEGKETMI